MFDGLPFVRGGVLQAPDAWAPPVGWVRRPRCDYPRCLIDGAPCRVTALRKAAGPALRTSPATPVIFAAYAS